MFLKLNVMEWQFSWISWSVDWNGCRPSLINYWLSGMSVGPSQLWWWISKNSENIHLKVSYCYFTVLLGIKSWHLQAVANAYLSYLNFHNKYIILGQNPAHLSSSVSFLTFQIAFSSQNVPWHILRDLTAVVDKCNKFAVSTFDNMII